MSQITLSSPPVEMPEAAARPAKRRRLIGQYMVLTKARLSLLVLLTTAAGFVLAVPAIARIDWVGLLWTILGTGLAAGSANALNQVMEVNRDARMIRTRNRPLPSGAMSRMHGVVLGTLLGYAGVFLLAAFVNVFAAVLAGANIIAYVFIYTPLKSRTTLNTIIGAVCGAVPPMIGWVGATGALSAGAWALAGILFLWQIPHFLALAWLYREDYERGGFRMLPIVDRSGQFTGQIALLAALALVPVSLIGALVGMTGWISAALGLVMGVAFAAFAATLLVRRDEIAARRLFLASLAYLSILMPLMVMDRQPGSPFVLLRPAGPGVTLVGS